MNKLKILVIMIAAVIMVMIPWCFGHYWDTEFRYGLMILHAFDTAIIYLLLRERFYDD